MPANAKLLPLLASVALAMGLAACGGGRTQVAAVCPDSGIIHGLDRMYAEDAAGNEVSVALENIDGVCSHSGNRLSLDMSIDLVVDAGPGTSIPYFVVVSDPTGQVLDKVGFVATVPADATTRPLRLRERLVQEVSEVPIGSSAAFTVLFGLDLPPRHRPPAAPLALRKDAGRQRLQAPHRNFAPVFPRQAPPQKYRWAWGGSSSPHLLPEIKPPGCARRSP